MAPDLALLGGEELKIYAQKLLKRLTQNYAVKVQAFALEADEFHLVVQWTPAEVGLWSDEEAKRRWLLVHPQKEFTDPNQAPTAGGPRVPTPREIRLKLGSLSMFMKQFKQMLAQKINREKGRHGSIWGERFHLAPLADAGAVAGAMAFVDLRQVVVSAGTRPEEMPFTGLHARVANFKGALGLPPYGPLGTPDGDMKFLPAEVTAELRVEEVAEMPENPPPNGDPVTMTDPLSGAVPVPGGLPEMPGYINPPMDGMGMNLMSPPPVMMPPATPIPMPEITGGGSPALAGALWSGEFNLPWFSLRKYLKLLDALVGQAKAWPHLPVGAPGRALAPVTPGWDGTVATLLAALGLSAAAFEAQWQRLATLRG